MLATLLALIITRTAPASSAPPALATLASDWVPYSRGLGHSADPPSWGGAPRHGLGLPTANNLMGGCIAGENVLAVRDLTFPPFTSGHA